MLAHCWGCLDVTMQHSQEGGLGGGSPAPGEVEQGRVNFSVLQINLRSIWDTDFLYICKKRRKQICPCGLSITATDFYVYDRDKDFLYMCNKVWKKERQGGRQEIILVNHLVKISVGMLEIHHAHVEGRKERELLWIMYDRYRFLCIHYTNLLIHTWPFFFF